MVIRLLELGSDLSLKDVANITEGITQSSVNCIRKRKRKYLHDLLRC